MDLKLSNYSTTADASKLAFLLSTDFDTKVNALLGLATKTFVAAQLAGRDTGILALRTPRSRQQDQTSTKPKMPGLLKSKKNRNPSRPVGQTSTKPKMPGPWRPVLKKKRNPLDPLGKPVLSQTRGQTITYISGLLTLVGQASTNPTCLARQCLLCTLLHSSCRSLRGKPVQRGRAREGQRFRQQNDYKLKAVSSLYRQPKK